MSDRQVDEFNKKIKELQDEAKETETILETCRFRKYISETYISKFFMKSYKMLMIANQKIFMHFSQTIICIY